MVFEVDMRQSRRGFSIIELVIAMGITLGLGAVIFTLFLQNTNVFRDQNLILEMQQTARAVASMMADDIRIAGQGTPTFASSMDPSTNVEAGQAFLNGSSASAILFRAGIDNGMAIMDTGPSPPPYSLAAPTTLNVVDADGIEAIIGANTDRFLYLWGEVANSWTWVRARITGINTGADTINVTPTEVAAAGAGFPTAPTIMLEQAIGYRLVSGNIERGISGDFTTQTAPVMTYQAVGENFTTMSFAYFDAAGAAVTITDVDDRARIRRVEFTLVAQTAEPLPSTGVAGTYEITMTVYPRNALFY